MNSDLNPQVTSLSKRISRAATVFVLLVGWIVLVGWILDIPILKSISPSLVSMKANTAISFLLSGIALLFLSTEQSTKWKQTVEAVCSGVVALLGGLTLSQYLFGVNLGIDQIFFTEQAGAVGTVHAGRMAPATAFNFLLVGISLLLYSRQVFMAARVLISLMAVVALFSFLGYLFGLSSLRNLGPFTPMALHTCITFIILAVSLLSMKVVFDSQFIIRAGFWVAIVTLFYIGVISYWNTVSQIEDAKRITHTQEVLQMLERILSDIKDVETSIRGFVITGNEQYLEPYYAQYNSIGGEINELRYLTSDNAYQQRRIDLLEPIVKDKIAFMSDAITLRRTKGFAATVIEHYQTPKGKQLMDEIRVKIGEMKNEENRLLQERNKKSETSAHNAVVTLVVGDTISFVLLAMVFLFLVRENRVRRKVEDEIRTLNAGLEQRVAERTAELKKSYETLQQSEERFRQTLDNMLEGVQIIGFGWRYLYVNDTAAKHGRRSKEEFGGHKMMEIYPGIEETEMFNVLRRCMDERIVQSIENEFIYPDGTKNWFELSIHPVPEGIFILSIDITDRKRVEEELKKHQEHLEELVEQRTKAVQESEEKFRNVFENSPIGKSLTTPDGQVHVNMEFASMLGYSVEELSKLNWKQITHPDDIEESQNVVASLIAGERNSARYQKRYLHRNGNIVWADISTFLQRDEHGKPQFFITSISDITERKRAEDRFRLVVESAPNAIVLVDFEGTIRLVNAQTERYFGYNRNELIGKKIEMLVPQETAVYHTTLRSSFFSHPEARSMGKGRDLSGLRKDGSHIPIEVGLNPIHFEEEMLVLASIIDISERKQADENIRQANAQLAAANKELEAFSYSVSHDLRAPLRSIDGFSQALLEDHIGKLDDQAKDHIHRVRKASQRMAQLIDDLLGLSRVTRAEMRREPVNLSDMASIIARELRKTQPERDVEFQIAEGVTAHGDPRLLRVALDNLLGNAWKFTSKHSQSKIEFGLHEIDGTPTYYVRDNGAGFDMTYADKLFGAFQRLHSMTEFPGTGIGLATVQRIIHRHGGKVWAEGAVKKGATFYFTIG